MYRRLVIAVCTTLATIAPSTMIGAEPHNAGYLRAELKEIDDCNAQGPAVTPTQLREDWLCQARLRFTDTEPTNAVTPAEDAAGGCDDLITGKWGFHTALEDDPWWQVDLRHETAIGQIVIYNRCDRLAERAAHIRVLVSADGITFETAYTHNGTVFLGKPDKKPLVVPLHGREARFIRLQLPGHSPARQSKLLAILTTGSRHMNLQLSPADLRRIITWIDLYGQTQGAFSAEQEQATATVAQATEQYAPAARRGPPQIITPARISTHDPW